MTFALLLLSAAVLTAPGALRTRTRLAIADSASPRPASALQETGPLGMAFSLDVFAVCLRAGMPVASAALAVAPTAPRELSAVLRRAAEMLALGASASAAWPDPDLSQEKTSDQRRALARLARRSADSGTAMAAGVAALAAQCRSDAIDAAVATAERAGVLIGAPLGLCFLPSFVCLGIAPVVIGLAADVFSGGVL